MSLSDFKTQRVNANKHTERGIKALDNSISKDGWIGAVTVAADGETFDGSARLEALADAMPSAEPIVIESDGTRPVIVKRTDIPDTDDPRAKRLGVAANVIAHMDYAPDGEILAMIAADDDAVARLIKQDELSADAVAAALADGLLGDADAEPQIDRAAELNEKWQVQRGDLWRIGEHRLLCGDSTKREDVERVMNGRKVGACVTDSPYGINREGIENDDPEGLRDLFDGVLACMPIENGIVINFQSPRLFPVWLDAIRAAKHKFERMLWMYKPNDETFPWRGWLQTSEAILISSKGNTEWLRVDPFAHDCYNPTTLGSELPKEWGKVHASVKPLVVVRDLISRIGGDVYEPFAGSGTTLVGCENLNRVCFALESKPVHCAIILERMATAFPGIEIERVSNGTA